MAGETLIGGTGYGITAGKALIGGTDYNITAGKTLIGGTAEDIVLIPKEYTMPALMKKATLAAIAGRDAGSTGQLSLTLPSDGTYYVFSFCYGYVSINKIVKNGSTLTKTVVAGNYTTSYGNVYIESGTLYYSSNGNGKTSVYGATLAAFQFSGYTEAEIDAIFAAATYTRRIGYNNKNAGTMGSASFSPKSNPATPLIATQTYIGFATVAVIDGQHSDVEIYYGNNADNPCLLQLPIGVWGSYISTALSLDGSTRLSAHGGSAIIIT